MALAETLAQRSISPWKDSAGTALRRPRPQGEPAPDAIGRAVPNPYGGSPDQTYPKSQTAAYSPLQRAFANRAVMQQRQQGYMQRPTTPQVDLTPGGTMAAPVPGVSMPSSRPPVDIASVLASRQLPGYAPRDWTLGRTYTPPTNTAWMNDPTVVADRAQSALYPSTSGPFMQRPTTTYAPGQTVQGFAQPSATLAGTLASRMAVAPGINSYRPW